MLIPLPRSTERLVRDHREGVVHPGLLLDKWPPTWPEERETKRGFDQESQRAHLEAVCRASRDWPPDFPDLVEQRRLALRALGAMTWRRRTAWRLTLHLARASALENAGISLHPIHGFPYLPGTGLKGLARAYAITVWLAEQRKEERQEAWEQILRVFGWALTPSLKEEMERLGVHLPTRRHEPGNARESEIRAARGAVVFHDAWPTLHLALQVDITNPHYSDYYRARARSTRDTPPPPGDYMAPVPVYFLVVAPGSEFEFAVAPADPSTRPETVQQALEWLDGGLGLLGAGAKTAAGYGYFSEEGEAAGPSQAAPEREEHSARRAARPASLLPRAVPKTGIRVRATLLHEKTRKGKWKARIEGTELAGVVQGEGSPDWQPGMTLDFLVVSSDPTGRDIQLKPA